MAKDAPKVPKFGLFLRQLRGDRSLQSLTNQLRAIGIERGEFSSLFRYEAGRVPPIDVLRGLSFALRLPFEDLVDRLLKELGITPVEWGKPIIQVETDLPPDALAVARAYAWCKDERLRAATRSLLLVSAEYENDDRGGGDRPVVQEKKTGAPVPRSHRSQRRGR